MHGGRECARGGAAWAGCRPMALGAVGPKLGARSVPGGGDATPLIHFSAVPHLTPLLSFSPQTRSTLCWTSWATERHATQAAEGPTPGPPSWTPPSCTTISCLFHSTQAPCRAGASTRWATACGCPAAHHPPPGLQCPTRCCPAPAWASPAAWHGRSSRSPGRGRTRWPARCWRPAWYPGASVGVAVCLCPDHRLNTPVSTHPSSLSLSLYVRVQQAPQASGAAGHQACDGVPSRSCHAG